LFFRAERGDRLVLLDSAYKFAVATYSLEIEPRWMYTYSYAPEQSWTVYRKDLSGGSYGQSEYVFGERVYFRVCLRKTDNSYFDGTGDLSSVLSFEAALHPEDPVKHWITDEALRVSDKVNALKESGGLVFALLTDSHYTVNGTWDDTMAGIRAVHASVGFDGVIHLGDMTDGMVPAGITEHYVKIILDGLNTLGVPVWIALGNHDTNYFKKNREPFSLTEQSKLYLGRKDPRYYVDFPGQRLRFIFLDSFDYREELRYGYSPECVSWLEQTLGGIPEDWKTVIFSHLPPMARLQYWAKEIRGETGIMSALNAHAGKITAFINGHNHADMPDNGTFPIISIANAKCESFTDRKPEGFVTPERTLGCASQECWDVLILSPGAGTARFVRFGAGRDRIVSNGEADWA
jgi:hypothetical protein